MKWPLKRAKTPDDVVAPTPEPVPVIEAELKPPAQMPVAAPALHGAAMPVVEPTEPPTPEVATPAEPVLQPPVRPKRRIGKTGARVAWVLAMSSIGAAVGGVIILGMKFIDGPVEGSTTKTVLSAVTSTSPTPSTNLLTGLYLEMPYPGVFDQIGQIKNDAQSLEQYNLGSKKDPVRMIAVSVRNLPSGKLVDESGYRFRMLNPQDYKVKDTMIGREPVVIMTKIDKTEATLFWPHGDKVAVVSITTNSGKDDISGFMGVVLEGIRWRR